jgi:Gamma-glutamyl cyclotransferase, AIG2-like
MSKSRIHDGTLISASTDVAAWKNLRLKLLDGLHQNANEKSDWEFAYSLFHTRIKTRFLNPIDWILEKRHNVGEGFSVVALQCILIEFLEAFYQGKIYTTSKEPRNFEYNSSRNLFCDFLMKHEPFSDYFKKEANATGFYDNIRCGLLHEAATKQTSRINNAPRHKMLVLFEENDPSNMRIYRENFYQALCDYIASYKIKLLAEKDLQMNFIRKWDDICGIKHSYYFAYGSNMLPERLLKRIGKYHESFTATLKDYKFTYNKKSKDGTAKANIEEPGGIEVLGGCFEIDDDDFSILQECEKGYDRRNITITLKDGKQVSAVTYISDSTDDTLTPSIEYKDLVLKGANYWDLDKTYVSEYLS